MIANGDNIKVILNGTTILEGNIREAAKNGTADGKDHPGLFNKGSHWFPGSRFGREVP